MNTYKKLSPKKQTIKMIHKRQEVSIEDYNDEIHTLYNSYMMYKTNDGKWVTIPVSYADEDQLMDVEEIAKWAAQWGLPLE